MQYLGAMVNLSTPPLFNSQLFIAINAEFYVTLVLAVIGSAPILTLLQQWWTRQFSQEMLPGGTVRQLTAATVQISSLVFVLLYSIACIMGGAHNPFLYFRF